MLKRFLLFILLFNGLNSAWSGKPISLNFQKISTRAVLKILADFRGMNMVIGDKVKGNMTLKLDNLPWEQALEVILSTQGLAKRYRNNVLWIDTQSAMEKRLLAQRKRQEAKENRLPLQSALLQINYAKASDMARLLRDKQNSLLSTEGKISVDKRTNTLWIQEKQNKLIQIRRLIKTLDVPVKQVLIEARIVEVSRDFIRDLGIRFGVSKPSHLSGTLAAANQLSQGVLPSHVNPYTKRLNVDLAASPLGMIEPVSVGLALAKLGNNVLLDLELSALESEGRGALISSPRLITTNQMPAVIESGQEVPYQEATSSGATAVVFKKAVLSLRVVPQITPDQKILMALKINQDSTSTQLYKGVPAILTKEIKTNVLVDNGQTLVLGGIYHEDKNKIITRLPFFGQLPFIGNLFKNTQVASKNNELLIFITPKIIQGRFNFMGLMTK